MDLSIVALRSLLEVSQRGTMTAAAEALGYTPGAISQHIASLSRAVGRPIVQQAGRRVKLTDAGLVVLEHARRVLASEALVESGLSGATDVIGGVLTIGAFESSSVLLGSVVVAVRELHPGLRLSVIEVREINTDNASLAVARSDVDAALGLDYPDAPIKRSDNLVYRVLTTERFGVVGLASSESRTPVSLKELANLDWVLPPPESNYGLAIRAACRRAGFEPSSRHVVTDTAMSLRLAAAGAGVTLATPLMMRFAGRPFRYWRELEGPLCRQVLLVTRASDRSRVAVDIFTDAIVDAVASLSRPEHDDLGL